MCDAVGVGGRDPRGPLFTDHYQLVMAQVYWREGLADRPAQFDYFYRSNPDYGSHQAGYAVTVGLDPLLAWMERTAVGAEELQWLSDLRGSAGTPVFDRGFLDWLAEHGRFDRLVVEAVPEGRVVHPHLPIVSVTGPLGQAQLLETPLLNMLNYPTLIATKATRLVQASRGAPVLEFGMRRGPGVAVDEAARAALVGGLSGTSNVQAAQALGQIPRGTHAHSLVQAFLATGEGELAAFRAFARAHPDDCVLLVDTVDTLRSGVPNAITVFSELRDAGHRPVGVRLDSGDLAYLSVQAAKQLDAAGFTDVAIVLSSELDELVIWQVLTQMADEAEREGVDWPRLRRRMVYGVGTRLITSEGDGALDGVYKLVGLQDAEGAWQPAVKLSENPVKVPIPGHKSVWRLYDARGHATADVVAEATHTPFADGEEEVLHHPHREDAARTLRAADVTRVEPLRQVVLRDGRRTQDPVPLEVLADRARDDLAALDAGVRRLVNPHTYHVSLTEPVKALQRRLVSGLAPAPPAPPPGPAGRPG